MYNKMDNLITKDYNTMLVSESDAYIAQDLSELGGSKTYYNMSWGDLLSNLTKDQHLYEIIKANVPCKMYFDIDAKYEEMDEDEKEYFTNSQVQIIKDFQQHLKDFCEDYDLPIPKIMCSHSSRDEKISFHAIIKNIILPTNKHRLGFYNKFIEYLGDEEPITRFIDKNVYNSTDRPKMMRLINQSKKSVKVPLKSFHKNTNINSHVITYTQNEPVTEIPDDWLPVIKVFVPTSLEDGIETDTNRIRQCLQHIDNKDYMTWFEIGQILFNLYAGNEDGLDLWIEWSRTAPNFDEDSCFKFWSAYKLNGYGMGKLVNMAKKNEPEPVHKRLLPEPSRPLDICKEDDYYWIDFEKDYIYREFESFEEMKENVTKDLTRVLVKITHGKGAYIKKEHKDDLCNIVQIKDLKRIQLKYKVMTKNGYQLTAQYLDTIYTACKLPLYSHPEIVLDPNEKTSAYNVFKGIKARQVETIDMNLINAFFKHIEEIICNDHKDSGHFFISWLRWIMVKPHIKSKVFVFLFSKEGYGKSTIGDFISMFIFGSTASYVCSGFDSIIAHFNKHLMGKLFVQVEELPATSETFFNQFNKVKHLVTDKFISCTPKGVDTFKIQNHINMFGCSNNKQSLRIPVDDTRYFTMEIIKKMPKTYWNHYFKTYQNQDFANMLYSYFLRTEDSDYVDFTGRPDIPMTDLKQELIDFSLAPYDRFYREVNSGEFKLHKSILIEPFMFKGKEYKYATTLTEIFKEYSRWSTDCGERDLKRKYLDFKKHTTGSIRFIDLEEKMPNIGNVEFLVSARMLHT